MCTIIAKKFPGVGWVGVKNRDRSFSTDTELLRDQINDIQRVTLMDMKTRWTEGMNSAGISIIASSLRVVESGDSTDHVSRNAEWFKLALSKPTLDSAVAVLKGHATGCVMIFNSERLWLLEGYNGGREYVCQEVVADRIARTNHGIWLPKAGYQPHNENPILRMRRISSVARLLIANHILDTANKPEEMMPMLAEPWTDNPQVTTLRKPVPGIVTRTTEQLQLEPSKRLMLVRNTDGVLEFDQADANPPGSQVLVGVVD